MELSKQQREIVLCSDKNIIVDAGSGSGKTRTLVERVKHLLNTGVDARSIVIITFTNRAADELYLRLSDTPSSKYCFIGTIHSYANMLLKQTGYDFEIFSEEYQTAFMKILIPKYARYCTLKDYEQFVTYDRLVAAGRMSKNDIKYKFPSEQVYTEIIQLLGREYSYYYKETVTTMCKLNNIITFDELIELTTKYFKENKLDLEYLFVDELQDIGYLEYNFLRSLKATNNFYIGDDYQCQPEGTTILMEDGSFKDISKINIGDKVVSYDIKKGYYFRKTRRTEGKSIINIQKSVSDKLLEIKTANGNVTRYTPNHRCFARINYTDETKNWYVVYLMGNEKGHFRIGQTKLFMTDECKFGLRVRVDGEKGGVGWILKVCKTKNEAWICEQLCAYKYGIPQMTWAHTVVKFTPDDIDYVYANLDNLRDKVMKCLSDFNRDIRYPLYSKYNNQHFSKNSVTEIRACNLIPDIMELAFPELNDLGYYHNKYNVIQELNILEGTFEVFCLEVEETGIYVGDNILTHNSIFSFKGGDVGIFLSLMKQQGWKVFYLTENYRTAKSILMYANAVIQKASDIIKKDVVCMNPNQGSLEFVAKSQLEKFLSKLNENEDWFLLTRSNKEMVMIDDLLKQHNINHYCFKQSTISQKKLKEITEKPCIKVLTVHASKGLECENVALYGKFPIKNMDNSEEIKVFYVGITRAKNRCVIFI